MEAYGRSDTGRVRATDQDAFVCGRLSEQALFVIVCDGMGGASGGNVASALAVRVIADRLLEGYRDGLPSQSVRHLLESAISAANVDIFDMAMADPELRGMGTTVVAAIQTGETLYLAHVGDSRAYLADQEELRQITRDHSIVQAMVERGQLTQEEARNHPRKHFITRALGVEDTVVCDFAELTLSAGQRVLICTDGLTNMVDTEEIYRLIWSADAPEVPDLLIHAANMAGGSDNITAVVMA